MAKSGMEKLRIFEELAASYDGGSWWKLPVEYKNSMNTLISDKMIMYYGN